MIDKVNSEFRKYHSLLGSLATIVDEDSTTEGIQTGNSITTQALRGRPSEPTVSINDQETYKKVIETLIDPRSPNGTVSEADDIRKSPEARTQLQRHVINIVGYIITILAVIFFGWNFGVYNHGDNQRRDVLWKVGAGYMMMMVALQVFKIVFFT